MVSGLPILISAIAQAAAPAASVDPAAPPAVSRPATQKTSATPEPDPETDEIVICVEKQDGYRIDPAIMDAERQAKRRTLKRPERHADTSCATVGPMGCTGGAGINVLGAAMMAGKIASRIAQGGNVGELFVTDPQPDEYQLYLEAKRRREAERSAKAAAPPK